MKHHTFIKRSFNKTQTFIDYLYKELPSSLRIPFRGREKSRRVRMPSLGDASSASSDPEWKTKADLNVKTDYNL